jgi:hypothetical protein
MKHRLAPALIATILAGTLAAQAGAQPERSSLSVASGKAAIDRYAGRLTHEIAAVHPAAPMSWQVLACSKRPTGVICTGEWMFAGEKCAAGMQAFPRGASIRVRQLARLRCSTQNDAQANQPPAA